MANVEAEKEISNPNVLSDTVSQNFHCNELEERRRKAEVRCGELEFELQKKKDQCEALEAKVKTLEEEKFAVEEELKVLRMLSEDGLKRKNEVCSEKERVIKLDLPEDNEAVQLMIENKVLECEKKKAESEVEFWKEKYKNLESWALQLGIERGSNYHEENGKKKLNNLTIIEGNLHLDTRFDFCQNKEKGVDLGNVMQSAGNNFAIR